MRKSASRAVKATPAQSAVQKAIVRSNVHPAEFGGPARGAAIASAIMADVLSDGSRWRDHFKSILATDTDARKAMRKELNVQKKALASLDKEAQSKMSRSSGVRISECMTVAKAADRGLSIAQVVEMWNAKGIGEPKTADNIAHAWVVESSRRWNETHSDDGAEVSSVGPTARRGRVALSPVEKARLYMLRNFAPKDFPKIATLVADFAKRIKTAKDLTAELAKGQAPKAAKNSGAADGREAKTKQAAAA